MNNFSDGHACAQIYHYLNQMKRL